MTDKKGGFKRIDIPTEKTKCLHTEHKPPTHIYLKPGQYEYICPYCGEVTARFTIPEVTSVMKRHSHTIIR